MKKYISILILFVGLGMTGCNDDFLEYAPKTSLTEATAFKSYDNFRTYAWSFYSLFSNSLMRQSVNYGAQYHASAYGDEAAGYLFNANGTNTNSNPWQWGTITSSTNTDSTWDFAFIRRVNIMLRNIDQSDLSESDKAHWRAVGLFFRAFRYYDMMARYGDVVWLDDVVSDTDTEILYGPRTSRDVVAANILRDLQQAEKEIKVNGEGVGTNTVNRACVRMVLSRFTLFEGTWRKYHGLANADTYLTECKRVSKALIDEYPTIATNFVDLWSSEDLGTNPSVILYKECTTDLIMTSLPRFERGGSQKLGPHARTVGRYLCQDGKPIATSSLYKGAGADADMYDEFLNRDHRLYWRVLPPYRTNYNNGTAVTDANRYAWKDDATLTAKDTYFINYMNAINSSTRQFPVYTWQPQFLRHVPMVQTSTKSWGPMRNYSGYYLYMYYNTYNDAVGIQGGGQTATVDLPIFHIEEAMLNYAEVMYELGEFNQSVADLTINKLRKRANVADMKVADINASFDPDRDPQVDPVAWEIRRERMVELLGEGFGFYDVRRWKRGDYFLNQRPLGVRMDHDYYFGSASIYVTESDVNADASVTADDIGRVVCTGDFIRQGLGWNDKYYLNPIPKGQTVLNPELGQNPGWD